ncbi:MAG: hypothetical protein SGPRY_000682, partial [Prymnesium sp.]
QHALSCAPALESSEPAEASVLSPSVPPTHPLDLPAELTILLTTSPSPAMPSTELLQAVLDSFVAFAPQVCGCRLIIVCDGTRPANTNNFRSGRVDGLSQALYAEYKQALHRLASSPSCGFSRAEVLELGEHHGFGLAVHAGIQLVRKCQKASRDPASFC